MGNERDKFVNPFDGIEINITPKINGPMPHVVTLRSYEELDDFYTEMESKNDTGCHECCPSRQVECALRRPISRNTVYMLTENEAEVLRNDERVLAVELTAEYLGIIKHPLWDQTANFYKGSTSFNNTDKNWGLISCTHPTVISDWGDTASTQRLSSKRVVTSETGKNVDVVIVDGHLNPDHPEFAVNANGAGGSRVIQLNWLTYNQYISGIDNDGITLPTGSYTYNTGTTGLYSSNDGNHGCHVAGTVAGNTQGWAREANIYNMFFNAGGGNGVNITNSNWYLLQYDYLRAFHRYKSINPLTGKRNPTVTNHSYGYSAIIPITSITAVNYRGTNFTNTTNNTIRDMNWLKDRNLYTFSNSGVNSIYYPYRSAADEADLLDAVNDGIIVIAAAGNDFCRSVSSSHPDYSNTVTHTGSGAATRNYCRGSSPGATDKVISIGNIDSYTPESYYTTAETTASEFLEEKSSSSHYGDTVDAWAPGTSILSSVNTNQGNGVTDPRNGQSGVAAGTWYYNMKSGTSMASPQVCGIAALYAERYPTLNNDSLRTLLHANARTNQTAEKRYRSWTVTASSNADYTLTPKPSGAASNDPAITARQSDILSFYINSGGSHPFSIVNTTTGSWTLGAEVGGVVNQGATSGVVTWNLKDVAPGTYRYICRNHQLMAGTITVVSDQRDSYGYMTSGTPNKYAFYKPIRGLTNIHTSPFAEYSRVAYPSEEFTNRPSTGLAWPRRKNRF